MRWYPGDIPRTQEGDPVCGIGKDHRVLVDGEEIREVVAFDTDEGWAVANCTMVGPGHATRSEVDSGHSAAHSDPGRMNEVCRVVFRGQVSVLGPEPLDEWSEVPLNPHEEDVA